MCRESGEGHRERGKGKREREGGRDRGREVWRRERDGWGAQRWGLLGVVEGRETETERQGTNERKNDFFLLTRVKE